MASGAGGVGLIAGAGVLPRLIAEALAKDGAPYLVVGFEGAAPDWLDAHPHLVTRFEKIGAMFRALREMGASRVVFAGGMTRPRLNPLRFDRTAARLAATVLPLLGKGDDALLAGLTRVVEAEGFEMVGAHALLGGLLAPAGDMAARAPSAADRADIARAAELVALIGAADVGQAAVVDRGLCVGLETLQGTDALLDFVARRPERLRAGGGAPSGVLYKAPKPGQDWRVDLPAIGPDTLRAAAAAGLAGVAAQAGGVLVLGLEETRAEADRLGLFLHGWTPPAADAGA
ncbi:LpxI family protein [Rubrimonas sp.]|uniref:LpxI family protein n=1 Tax=Rubrimonas sp. TaxID=2036015 RepID=UPI002FDE48FA